MSNAKHSADLLAPSLADSILNFDLSTTKTILKLNPKIVLHQRFLESDILSALTSTPGEQIRESMYESDWFPAGDSFGEVVKLSCETKNVDSLRWYFSRWWERDALPLSSQLENHFQLSLKNCVIEGDYDCLNILLLRGIHRLPGVLNGLSLLHDSIRLGHHHILTLLLDSGIDPNYTPDGVLLPIEVALSSGRVSEVLLLLRHGARLYVNSTPPIEEISFTEFRSGQSWSRNIADGFPWVMLIIEQHFIEKYDLLAKFVDHKAHAVAKSKDNRTLAHELVTDMNWAFSTERSLDVNHGLNTKRLDLLRRVLEAGISPNMQDADGWTPVLHAVLIGDTDALSVLYRYNIDFSLCSSFGTALTLAAQRGAVNTVAWLLEHGADKNQTDSLGFTPMYYAEESNNIPILALLAS